MDMVVLCGDTILLKLTRLYAFLTPNINEYEINLHINWKVNPRPYIVLPRDFGFKVLKYIIYNFVLNLQLFLLPYLTKQQKILYLWLFYNLSIPYVLPPPTFHR